MDLAFDNVQWLICYKTKPNQTTQTHTHTHTHTHIYIYISLKLLIVTNFIMAQSQMLKIGIGGFFQSDAQRFVRSIISPEILVTSLLFYGILTLGCYLILSHLYTYILDI